MALSSVRSHQMDARSKSGDTKGDWADPPTKAHIMEPNNALFIEPFREHIH